MVIRDTHVMPGQHTYIPRVDFTCSLRKGIELISRMQRIGDSKRLIFLSKGAREVDPWDVRVLAGHYMSVSHHHHPRRSKYLIERREMYSTGPAHVQTQLMAWICAWLSLVDSLLHIISMMNSTAYFNYSQHNWIFNVISILLNIKRTTIKTFA